MRKIEAQPFDFAFDPAHTALIVIDMQRDFIEPGGFGATLGNDVSLLKKIVPTVGRLVDAFRMAGLPIIHTRECHKPDLSDLPKAKHLRGKPSMRIGDPGPMGRILIAGEPGADIIPELAARPGEIVLDKPGKSSFYATDLEQILHEHDIRNLLGTGVTTDVCCHATVIGANDRGFNAIVLADGVASYSPERHAAALATISAQGGMFGWVTTSEQVLKAMAG